MSSIKQLAVPWHGMEDEFDILRMPAALSAPVRIDNTQKGRIVIATRPITAGGVFFAENAASFSVGSDTMAGDVAGLPFFGKVHMTPIKNGSNEGMIRRAILQLHPEQRSWADVKISANSTSYPIDDYQARDLHSLWDSLGRVMPTSKGAATAFADSIYGLLRKDFDQRRPRAPDGRDRTTGITSSLACVDEATVKHWLVLRAIAPMNSISCKCRVPAGDAILIKSVLRDRLTDLECRDAGVDPVELFSTFDASGVDGGEPTVEMRLSGLFLLTSMLNHDCAPNCYFRTRWDSEMGCPQVTIAASRAIAEGEELSISYLGDGPKPRAERLAHLAGYGFECGCGRCAADFDDTLVLTCPGCRGPLHAPPRGGSATCASCSTVTSQDRVQFVLGRRSLVERMLDTETGDESDMWEGGGASFAESILSALHTTDAVRIAARTQQAHDLIEARRYAPAMGSACEVADALCGLPWVGHRRRFFALVDAGEACALAGEPQLASAYFQRGVDAIARFTTDTSTPLMAALLALLRRAVDAPPPTAAAARRFRRERNRVEDELEDDDY